MESNLQKFAKDYDKELHNLVANIELLKQNMKFL